MQNPDLIKDLVLIGFALGLFSGFTFIFVNALVRFLIWLENVERRPRR